MKKIFLVSIVIAMCSFSSFAQKHTISVNAGSSFIGVLINNISISDSSMLDFNAQPVVNFAYDYRVKSWFSIGAAYSFQYFDGTIFSYKNDSILASEEVNVNFTVKRSNFAIRPLFYYPASNKLNLYSGLRIGILSSSVAIDAEVPGLVKKDVFKVGIGTRPSIQVIFLGLQYAFSEHIGIHTEVALGAPYYACLGLHAKF